MDKSQEMSIESEEEVTCIYNYMQEIPKEDIVFVGIFKVNNRYGIGVYQHDPQHQQNGLFITLSGYFEAQQEQQLASIKVYFPKINCDINLKRFQIQKYNQVVMIIPQIEQGQIFTKFSINKIEGQQRNPPNLINGRSLKDYRLTSGYVLGIQKVGKNQEMVAIQFKDEFKDVQTRHLQLKLQVGLIFFNETKDKQKFLYGFFDQLNRKRASQDYFLYKEALKQPQASQQIHTGPQSVVSLQKQPNKYPFNSIVKIVYKKNQQDYSGTGSLILNGKNQCLYLISCAHNFISKKQTKILQKVKVQYDDRSTNSDFSHYTFYQLTARQLDNQPTRYQLEDLKLQIDQIFVHDQYIKQLKEQINIGKGHLKKEIKFQIKKHSKIQVSKSSIYDIAIIKLKKKVDFKGLYGFKLKPQQCDITQAKDVWVAGFPIQNSEVKTQKDMMYSQSTLNRRDGFVEFSEDSCLIKHYLFTLAGSSGSPIFQQNNLQTQVSQNKAFHESCYLFGIHTTGLPKAQRLDGTYEPKGKYNYATYIYHKDIIDWLRNKFPDLFSES